MLVDAGYYLTLGAFLGYPKCCSLEFVRKRIFVEEPGPAVSGPWTGTGFIPCLKCAGEARNFTRFIEERIQPNRKCSSPFPDDSALTDAEVRRIWDTAPVQKVFIKSG